jgi:SAM-dependent methyltransferase
MLEGIPDKRQDKNTTSLKFKQDVIDFFQPLKLKTCLEIGTNKGWTTRILSELFEHVMTIENSKLNLDEAIQNNSDKNNIEYLLGDAYNSDWDIETNVDVTMIDCIHDYSYVKQDIKNSLSHGVKYIIFDDYGLPEDKPCVKAAVDEFIQNNTVEVTYIGEPAGSEPRVGRTLIDWEGVIIKL